MADPNPQPRYYIDSAKVSGNHLEYWVVDRTLRKPHGGKYSGMIGGFTKSEALAERRCGRMNRAAAVLSRKSAIDSQ